MPHSTATEINSLYPLAIISVVVGIAGLAVGLIQLVLMFISFHEDKKNRR